ncbi:Protein kinase-like domain [Pseudocohnilembus persalinus]|uniref:Protein kinase-like domain n=1 Tax=Pseudocohnilembus persalinus TaxID=266149 RepID=A0A0V0QME8_PSEPJ|nr:Protein kinase-like domain [Pseudocohnilembus persalinus]|eukprot:KRX03507.1 Protein kinase-like domain [Pseudocohnilembus persalinus]
MTEKQNSINQDHYQNSNRVQNSENKNQKNIKKDSPKDTQQKNRCIGNYTIGKKLGEGAFGKVRLGIHNLTGEKVAIKILEKEKIIDVTDVERVSREIHILKLIKHPHIVQLYEIIETPNQIFLVMEFISGGEVYDYIVEKNRLPEAEACRLFQELISGIEYLHKLQIVHRDLKPENLMLNKKKGIKIVDFGLSNTYKKNELLKTACGSPCYAAPEMIAGKKYESKQVDVWSSGVILYAFLCGFLPFEDPNISELYKKILNGQFELPEFLSADAKDFLTNILNTDPQTRLNFEQIKNHKWFNCFKRDYEIPQGIIVGYNRYPVDQKILQELEQYGLKQDYVQNCLDANKHNHVTTSYHLLLRKYLVEGKDSFADFNSQKFDHTLLIHKKRPPKTTNNNMLTKDLIQNVDKENKPPSNKSLAKKTINSSEKNKKISVNKDTVPFQISSQNNKNNKTLKTELDDSAVKLIKKQSSTAPSNNSQTQQQYSYQNAQQQPSITSDKNSHRTSKGKGVNIQEYLGNTQNYMYNNQVLNSKNLANQQQQLNQQQYSQQHQQQQIQENYYNASTTTNKKKNSISNPLNQSFSYNNNAPYNILGSKQQTKKKRHNRTISQQVSTTSYSNNNNNNNSIMNKSHMKENSKTQDYQSFYGSQVQSQKQSMKKIQYKSSNKNCQQQQSRSRSKSLLKNQQISAISQRTTKNRQKSIHNTSQQYYSIENRRNSQSKTTKADSQRHKKTMSMIQGDSVNLGKNIINQSLNITSNNNNYYYQQQSQKVARNRANNMSFDLSQISKNKNQNQVLNLLLGASSCKQRTALQNILIGDNNTYNNNYMTTNNIQSNNNNNNNRPNSSYAIYAPQNQVNNQQKKQNIISARKQIQA